MSEFGGLQDLSSAPSLESVLVRSYGARQFFELTQRAVVSRMDRLFKHVRLSCPTPALLVKGIMKMLDMIDQWNEEDRETVARDALTSFPDLEDLYVVAVQLYIAETFPTMRAHEAAEMRPFNVFFGLVFNHMLHAPDTGITAMGARTFSRFLTSGAYFDPANFAQREAFHRRAIEAALAESVRFRSEGLRALGSRAAATRRVPADPASRVAMPWHTPAWRNVASEGSAAGDRLAGSARDYDSRAEDGVVTPQRAPPRGVQLTREDLQQARAPTPRTPGGAAVPQTPRGGAQQQSAQQQGAPTEAPRRILVAAPAAGAASGSHTHRPEPFDDEVALQMAEAATAPAAPPTPLTRQPHSAARVEQRVSTQMRSLRTPAQARPAQAPTPRAEPTNVIVTRSEAAAVRAPHGTQRPTPAAKVPQPHQQPPSASVAHVPARASAIEDVPDIDDLGELRFDE